MKRARVILADDHQRVAAALHQILCTEFDVVEVVGDGLSLIRAVTELEPDVIVVDVSMPELDGLSALKHLRAAGSPVKVVMVSGFYEPSFINVAVELGASGFVSKYAAFDELIPAVRAALDGRIYRSETLLS